MNTTTFFASGALLLAAGLTPVAAQATGTTSQPHNPQTTPSATATAAASPTTPARASEIIGQEIVDAGGKKIAEIKDLVVCDSGEVVAIVETETRDGAMVGVPLCHLQVKIDEDQREAKAKDKEENLAKGAPTPDIDNFALMGDRTLLDTAPVLKDEKTLDVMWVTSSREHFGVDKNATKPEAAGERGTSAEKAVASTATKPTCVKHLIGENVKGSDGDGIGDVKDVAIDLRTSQVAYAIVSSGGVLGMGDALHAIPFAQLTITEDVVTVPMNKDGVSNLPKLDLDRLPNNSTSMVVPERGNVATDGNPDRGTGR